MGIDSTAPKRWNLTPLANGDDDPELEAKTQVVLDKNYEFINKWKERPEYLSDPQVLREALDEYEELNSKYGTSGDAGYYWGLRLAQEQSNPQLKARYNKLEDIAHKITNDIRFFELDLSKIDQEAQNKFLKSPELIKYKHYLEVLFAQAKYLLSDAEESVLTLTSSPAYSNWTHMVSEFISDSEVEWEFEGESGHKHFSELSALMESQNKAKRDLAAEHFNKILLANVNSAEHELNSVLQYKKALDLLRGAERPDEMRHVGDDISSAVVDTMLEVVEQNFEIAHSFYELKAKLLGQKKLEYHERNVAYGEVDTEYSYDRSVEMVSKVLSQLDPELLSIFEGFLANDNIDVFPQQGKHPGAFATAALPSQPSYILLNHTDKLNDVLTLAHEVGHGINNELIRKAQHALYFDTPLSTAEVASTFMEDFVLDEILKDADDELKLAIIMMKLNSDISTIFRQVAAYRFEQEMHQEFRELGYLPSHKIGELFLKHMESYMGPAVEQSTGAENWWVYWGHLRAFFYNYSYASGLLISKSLQSKTKQSPEFIQEVKGFLAAGTSDSPQNIFKKLGIDITDSDFWQQGISEVQELLSECRELAEKLGKI